MALERITGEAQYAKYSELAPGTVIAAGWLVGMRKNRFGGGNDYIIEQPDKVKKVVNKSGLLRWAIEESGRISIGDYIVITFLGKKKLEKGQFKGADSNDFDVSIDPAKGKYVTGGIPTIPGTPAIDNAPNPTSFQGNGSFNPDPTGADLLLGD